MNRRDFIRSVAAGVGSSSLSRTHTRDFDYIIVGAGSSGCVLANRLSANLSVRVLLIEAGGPDTDPALSTPGRWVSLLGSAVDWNYHTEADPGLAGRSIRWPRGKVYGGSSAINAMAYVRGDARCYDDWARVAGAAWSYARVEPYFARIERDLAIAETTDPHAGHVAFLAAARELGVDGAHYYRKTIRNGRRQSAASAFLTPVLSRPNLEVWPHTTTRRLILEGRRVRGVEVERTGQVEQVRAAREIVLSAGVIGSPKILMLSRVGSPAVGTNLQDHPRVSVRWKSLKQLAPSTTSAGLFVRSSGATIPDLQFYVGRGVDTPDDFITLTVALSQPRSRGTVTLFSRDPSAAPIIRPNYFADASDLDRLVEGVRLAQRLASAKAYTGLRGDPADPGPDVQTDEELRAWIRRAADTIFHPVGTCRMGSGSDAVVDPELRVRGVEGLRIADASIMPTVVNGQTNAACLMIAEKAADLIAAVQPRR